MIKMQVGDCHNTLARAVSDDRPAVIQDATSSCIFFVELDPSAL
jgi:hypothetical protein